ncbi:MAG: thioredoxin domain-containing protein [Deltaproteobacteria bacterium]|jgi:protein-disulfide isomerase|nr:thioredoxin domain-containing protein [Deltaproteobacteria bacterium]
MMPLFEQVLDKYPDSVKIVYKHYPLSFHKEALQAALASLAAAEQGRFWEYHDELYLNQNSLSKEKYIEIAKNLGLDLKKFSLDIMRPSLRKKVEEDIQDAQKAGVTGTPSIFVNGRQLKIRDFQTLSKLIDAELAEGQK